MPFRDGTGPVGGGFGRGRRRRGLGRGRGFRRGPSETAGPGGFCICPGCGEKVAHQPGVPCSSLDCPKCGLGLVRE